MAMKAAKIRANTVQLENEISNAILRGLARKGMMQIDLASRIEISPVHMCNLLAGRSRWTLDVALTALQEVGFNLAVESRPGRR